MQIAGVDTARPHKFDGLAMSDLAILVAPCRLCRVLVMSDDYRYIVKQCEQIVLSIVYLCN